MFKNKNGITLVALVVTIIILLILAGISIASLTGSGLIAKLQEAVNTTEKAEIEEKVKSAVMETLIEENSNITDKTNKEIFEKIKSNLDLEDAIYKINSQTMNLTTKEGFVYTLLVDGTIIEGEVAYLDIADGSIQLKSNGYVQGENTVEYTGKYIITGTTTENSVKITDVGTYDITIKDLNIDVSSINGMCAFNANRGSKETGCYVIITLEGENRLYGGGSAPGLGFAKAAPNVDGVTNGSTLTIQGEGSLETIGGGLAAGIGTGYSGGDAAAGDANNITINSGNIIAKAGNNACAIGSSLRKNANNIVINGGNINAIASNRYGIGASAEGILKNLTINGGTITANGGEYGGVIGGGTGSGEIKITGGYIFANHTHRSSGNYSTIGHNCSPIKIEGGTIICNSAKGIGIGTTDVTENIQINGGNIVITAGTSNFAITPTDSEHDVYLTEIQLENIAEKIAITSLTTSDNINYGIKDMYTIKDDESTEDTNEGGMLYLYLPLGTRTITVEADGKNYSGIVETKEESLVVVLNKQ